MKNFPTSKQIALIALMGLAPLTHAEEKLPFSFEPMEASAVDPSALERFNAPLEATITAEALSPVHAVRQSYTSGTARGAVNAINSHHGGFEPMAFRPKFRVVATDANRVVLDASHAASVAEGFYDGARVRVYQAIDGEIVKIRDSVLPDGGHAASGWVSYRGGRQTDANRTDFKVAIDGSFLPNRRYWAMVRAIDIYGRESEPSPAASFEIGEAKGQINNVDTPPSRLNYKSNPPADSPLPQPPAGLRVTQKDNVLHLEWEASPTPPAELAGYRIYFTGYDPAKHRGFALELPSREPRPDRTIQERDIVFVDQFKGTLDNQDRSPFVDWPANRKLSSPFHRSHIQKDFQLWSDGSDGYPAQWAFKSHDSDTPDTMTGRGKTFLEWKVDGEDLTGFPVMDHAGNKQGWYQVLDTQEYTLDVWVRGSGTLQFVFVGPYAPKDVALPYGQKAHPSSTQWIDPIDIPLTDKWTRITRTFTPPFMIEEGIGSLLVSFKGPGTLHMDNLKIFRSDHPYGEFQPITHQRIRETDSRYIRTHELIKTVWGFSLDSMIGDAMGGNYSGDQLRSHTLFTLLNNLLKAGKVSPWLQVEMSLDEDEWLGFVEWLCAPYDPAKGDTPESKPWAHTRWSMGQKEPWIEVFPEFAFEISNETWNQTFKPYDWDWGMALTDGGTGRNFSYGETYGLFNEYIINQMRKSPHWSDAVEKKMRVMLCGWQAAQAFGAGAARMSPSADLVSYAAYIGTDGLGDRRVMNDFKRFYILQWSISAIDEQSARNRETEKWLRARGREIESGIYEHGYNFLVMPGDPKEAKEVDQQLARSLVGAVSILDATLARYAYGMTDQAFFTFGHEIGAWGSHTMPRFGGHAYPYAKAMTLFNEVAAGGLPLRVELQSVPTWDFPAYEAEDNMHMVKRSARPNAPLVSVYGFAQDDKVAVFLISRKIDNFPVAGDDGFTPATIKLPFSKAKKITLHRLAGNPRVDDRFEELNHVETIDIPVGAFNGTFPINENTGAEQRGLPPVSVFCYLFEGTDMPEPTVQPSARFELPEAPLAGDPLTLRNTSNDTGLTAQWKLASGVSSTETNLDITFPEARLETVELTVTNQKGLADTLVRDNYPVGVRFGNTTWHPLPAPVRLKNPIVARVDGDSLQITANQPITAEGNYGLLAAPIRYRDTFTLDAELASTAPGDAPAGIVLATNPRTGLGFNHDMDLTLKTPASLLVKADGSVHRLTGRGPQTEQLLPAGALTFPARLRLAVEDLLAIASVETGGAWKEVARFDLPQTGVFPSLTATASATFANASVNPERTANRTTHK